MPWPSGEAYAKAHNKKLKGAAAEKARKMAEAMIASGTPESVAIATANKHGDAMMRRSTLYDHKKG
jgi:uncharacterized protein YdaT